VIEYLWPTIAITSTVLLILRLCQKPNGEKFFTEVEVRGNKHYMLLIAGDGIIYAFDQSGMVQLRNAINLALNDCIEEQTKDD